MKTSMRLAFTQAILFLCIACLTNESQANLFITAGEAVDTTTVVDAPVGPFTAGSTVTIPFFAHFDGAIIQNPITSYSLPIDLGADGEGLPPAGAADYFSNFTAVSNPALGGSFLFDDVSGFIELDFLAELTGGNAVISTDPASPTLLFELFFDTDPATPSGVFDVTIPQGTIITDSQTAVLSNAIPVTDLLLIDNGQFIIAAVPEPTTITLTACFAILGGVGRRRRR